RDRHRHRAGTGPRHHGRPVRGGAITADRGGPHPGAAVPRAGRERAAAADRRPAPGRLRHTLGQRRPRPIVRRAPTRGPPPPRLADDQARRFEKRLLWLLLLVLLLALLFTGGNAVLGTLPWAEMPSNQALLHAERGPTTAVVNGHTIALRQGQDVYVGQ